VKVRGITIEIGGDTTKLEASLKSVNQEIKGTESKLKDPVPHRDANFRVLRTDDP
jgi:phage-related minor tail protein